MTDIHTTLIAAAMATENAKCDARSVIPDGTRFPAKTHAYGRKTRFEIATSTDGGRRSVINSADQRTRGGVQWAYDTREAAQRRCAELNEARARGLVEKGAAICPAPYFYEKQVAGLVERGEFIAAAVAYEMARGASIGHTRRQSYEDCANPLARTGRKTIRRGVPVMTAQPFVLGVYRSKPHAHQAPGGYWFLRIGDSTTSKVSEVTLTPGKAAELLAMGIPQLPDGGNV